jgi:hypothetical protein
VLFRSEEEEEEEEEESWTTQAAAAAASAPTEIIRVRVGAHGIIAALSEALERGEAPDLISETRCVVEKVLQHFAAEGPDDVLMDATKRVLSQMLAVAPPLDSAVAGICAILRAVAPNVAAMRAANAWNIGQIIAACVEPLELLIADECAGADAMIESISTAAATPEPRSAKSPGHAALSKMIRTPGADGIGRAFGIRDVHYTAAHEDYRRCLALESLQRKASPAEAAKGTFIALGLRTNTLVALMLRSRSDAERRNPSAKNGMYV